MKNLILYMMFLVIVNALAFIAIWKATSPEYWYSGMHDSECEKILYGSKCHCYERFVANDKTHK